MVDSFDSNADRCSTRNINGSNVTYFVPGLILLCISLVLIIFLRRSRYLASKGVSSSSFVLYLPIYYYTMWYVIALTIVIALQDIIGNKVHDAYYISFKFGLTRLVVDGLAVFLMHNGVVLKSIRNGLMVGCIVALGSVFFRIAAYLASSWQVYRLTPHPALFT